MAGRNKGHPKTGGRKPGSPNVFTSTVRESVLSAFQNLQADPNHNLLSWARLKTTEFYQIASKLIPTEIAGTITQKIINVEYSDNLAKDSYTTSGATSSPEDEKTV